MAVVSMNYLLEAGVHFGHQTKRWNPKMKEYIFTSRDEIYIIDLQKTAKKIEEAYKILLQLDDFENTKELKEKVINIVKSIDPILSIHDFRVVYGDTHTNLLFDVSMPINFSCSPKELRELISLEIKKLDGNYFAVIQIDQLYNRKA